VPCGPAAFESSTALRLGAVVLYRPCGEDFHYSFDSPRWIGAFEVLNDILLYHYLISFNGRLFSKLWSYYFVITALDLVCPSFSNLWAPHISFRQTRYDVSEKAKKRRFPDGFEIPKHANRNAGASGWCDA
jgi:hypothetical protein